MENIFNDLMNYVKKSNHVIRLNENTLKKELHPTIVPIKTLDIDDERTNGIKVMRQFKEKWTLEYQLENVESHEVEYHGSILFDSDMGIGSITYDDKQYIGLLNSDLEPCIAGIYVENDKSSLYISVGIEYGMLKMKPVKKNQNELLDFLNAAVINGYLNENILRFMKEPELLLKEVNDCLNQGEFQFKDVELFSNGQTSVMKNVKRKNKKYETIYIPSFDIINQDGSKTDFTDLTISELNVLVTLVNKHYVETKEVLYPLAMVARNSELDLEPSESEEDAYYISTANLKDFTEANYYQFSNSDNKLKKVDLKVSGDVSGVRFNSYIFTNRIELNEVANYVQKWKNPTVRIFFNDNDREILSKELGNQYRTSITTEVLELSFFFKN